MCGEVFYYCEPGWRVVTHPGTSNSQRAKPSQIRRFIKVSYYWFFDICISIFYFKNKLSKMCVIGLSLWLYDCSKYLQLLSIHVNPLCLYTENYWQDVTHMQYLGTYYYLYIVQYFQIFKSFIQLTQQTWF